MIALNIKDLDIVNIPKNIKDVGIKIFIILLKFNLLSINKKRAKLRENRVPA